MSTESQAEQIWQYAMRGRLSNEEAKDASVDGIGIMDVAMEESALDFSEGFSFPSKLEFHGLAEPMSQWSAQEAGAEEFGSQGYADAAALTHIVPTLATESPRHQIKYLGVARGHASGGGNDTEPVSGGHVTEHVTSAPSRTAVSFMSPVKGSATDPGLSAAGALTTVLSGPLNKRSKAVSFDTVHFRPQPPPTLLRNHTMPPRLNRYAARNVVPSSQDSFADPISQDLNSYVRNAKPPPTSIDRTGGPAAAAPLYEGSSAEPPPKEKPIDVSNSFTETDDSVELRDPRSPQLPVRTNSTATSRVEPIVLVKDSQSQSQDSDKSEKSLKSAKPNNQAEDDVRDALYQYSHGDLSPTASLASSSLRLEQNPPVPTQTQSSEASSQTSPLFLPPETMPPPMLSLQPSMRTDISGPSPFHIPPYRKKELEMWQRAQQRDVRDEVVPETPASTEAVSLPASRLHVLQPHLQPMSSLNIEQTQTQTQTQNTEDEVDAALELPKRPPASRSERPLSKGKGKGKGKEVVSPVKRSPERHLRSTTQVNKLESSRRRSERLSPTRPDQASSSKLHKASLEIPSNSFGFPGRAPPSDLVPDSQEDEQQEQHAPIIANPSSPFIPLREALQDEPPTPAPPTVKSALRRGEVPTGVTHTRGRGRPRVVKGKAKEKNQRPGPQPEQSQLSELETAMDVKEGGILVTEPEIEPAKEKSRPALRSARRKGSTAKTKDKPIIKKETRSRRAATAVQPATRKRKNDLVDSSKESVTTREKSVPPKKRQCSSFKATSVSSDLSIRVFARYAGPGSSKHTTFYLPGNVIVNDSAGDLSSANRFTVRFDNGMQREVEVADMRQYELVLNDLVYVVGEKGSCSKAEVLDVERWATDQTVEVHDTERGVDGDDYYVEGRLIKVAEEDVYAQWRERCVSTRTLFKDRDFPVPPANEALAGIGFMVTLPDLPKSKRSLVEVIEASGGLLYSDWSSVVALSGTMEAGGKRMLSKAPEIKIGKDTRKASTPKLIFCLSDEPKMTPKYLIALALGVPCISMEWVLNRVEEAQKDSPRYIDWQAYILPAGQNPLTRLPASQAFARAWWKRDDDRLSKLLSDPPVLKPFEGKKFLCVGPAEFLFPDKEFGTFPKLLLAMGASSVQAVVDITYASLKNVDNFDYTVVDDGYDVRSHRESAAVNVTWIKKCLLTGCEGPVPWPE